MGKLEWLEIDAAAIVHEHFLYTKVFALRAGVKRPASAGWWSFAHLVEATVRSACGGPRALACEASEAPGSFCLDRPGRAPQEIQLFRLGGTNTPPGHCSANGRSPPDPSLERANGGDCLPRSSPLNLFLPLNYIITNFRAKSSRLCSNRKNAIEAFFVLVFLLGFDDSRSFDFPHFLLKLRERSG